MKLFSYLHYLFLPPDRRGERPEWLNDALIDIGELLGLTRFVQIDGLPGDLQFKDRIVILTEKGRRELAVWIDENGVPT